VTRYLPLLLGVMLIVGLTIQEIRMTDRLSGTNVSAEQRAELLSSIPKDFGDWHGEDKAVDATVQKVAGAIGAISRDYHNSRTGERVDLWLIVGHSRDVAFHTPDVCYRGSGFEARGKENSLYPLVMQGMPDTPMWTNTFFKEDVSGRSLLRVFWTWYNPESAENDGKIVWEAPTNARFHFGNSRALYKMYFTSEMRDPMETAEQSSALRFAKDFLPEVNKALLEMHDKLHEGTPGSSANASTAPADTKPTEPADSANTEKTEPSTDDKSAATPADGAASAAPAETPAKSSETPAEPPKAQAEK
jgi:hypothetical protein